MKALVEELRSEHFDRAGTIVRLVLALIALARVAAAHAQTIAPTADALGLSPAAVRSLKEDVTNTGSSRDQVGLLRAV